MANTDSTTTSPTTLLTSTMTPTTLHSQTASKTTSSYTGTFSASIPTTINPYINQEKGLNGTVFIIVGTIIISIITAILAARFWFWLKNRRATDDDKAFEDYYGGQNDDSHGLLNYDSAYFGKEKPYNIHLESSPESGFSHSTNSSSASAGDIIRPDINNLTSQPGRTLRGTTQSYIPPVKRNSFISPINALIESQHESSDILSSDNNRSFSASNITNSSTSESIPSAAAKSEITPSERRNRSISVLFNANSPNLGAHSRAASAHLNSVEKMVNQSLIDLNQSRNNQSVSNKATKKPRRNTRPASQVLDMLVLQDLMEDDS